MHCSAASGAVRTVAMYTVQPPELQPHAVVHLTPWDLSMLSLHYLQSGLLYANIPADASSPLPSRSDLVSSLKSSLSSTLAHYAPLAGRLVVDEVAAPGGESTTVSAFVDCCGLGAQLVHAVADGVTVGNVLAPDADVPPFVFEFFPLNGAVNIDGRSLPLFAVQVTELVDGVFVGWAFNHAVGDGVSLWNLMASWSQAARAGDGVVFAPTRKPIFEPWFLDGHGEQLPLKATFSNDKFIERFAPPLRHRVFRFSAASIAELKTRALKESSNEVTDVSSFEALVSFMWRCVTRARRSPPEAATRVAFSAGNRARLTPPLSDRNFGNIMSLLASTPVQAGELLANGLAWAVSVVAATVAGHTDEAVRAELKAWMEAPETNRLGEHHGRDLTAIMLPKFEVYGVDLGFGRPVALRSGRGIKCDGSLTMFQADRGAGDMNVQVSLMPEAMEALLKDEEFLAAVSLVPPTASE